MSKAPKMPFFVDAYLADTQHLTLEEHGAYLLLLFTMWRRNGSVPDNDTDNARILGISVRKWKVIKERLRPLLYFFGAEISQKRLQKEFNEVMQFRATQSERGKKGALSRWSVENQALNDSLRHSRKHGHKHGSGDGGEDDDNDGRKDGGKIASHSHKRKIDREVLVEGQSEPQQADGAPDGPPPVATPTAEYLLKTDLMTRTKDADLADVPETKRSRNKGQG